MPGAFTTLLLIINNLTTVGDLAKLGCEITPLMQKSANLSYTFIVLF